MKVYANTHTGLSRQTFGTGVMTSTMDIDAGFTATSTGRNVEFTNLLVPDNGPNFVTMVEIVKYAFGLNTKQLAEAFDVSRPTVYAWLEEDDPQPHAQSSRRARMLYALARLWMNAAGEPMSVELVKARIRASQNTLLSILSEKTLDLGMSVSAIINLLELSKRIARRKETLSEKLAKRGAKAKSSLETDQDLSVSTVR